MKIRPYTVRFLLCHVSGDMDACDLIYGNSTDSLCGNEEIKYKECEALGGPSMPNVHTKAGSPTKRWWYNYTSRKTLY